MKKLSRHIDDMEWIGLNIDNMEVQVDITRHGRSEGSKIYLTWR